MVRRSLACALLLVATGGCAADDESEPGGPSAPPQTCFAPSELGGSPQTVEDVVALINALPKPLSVPCLLQTFDRPLEIDATSNTFSAQPANGANNPRIFIYKGDMAVSVVTKGDGRKLVEFSVLRSVTRSIKAEIVFPVEAQLDEAAPYDRIRDDDGIGTKCAFCHLSERLDVELTMTDVYESDVLEMPSNRRVDLEYLEWVFNNCDRAGEPDRCAMFDSIFAYGAVVPHPR